MKPRKKVAEEFKENLVHLCRSKDIDEVCQVIKGCKASWLPQVFDVIVKYKLMDPLGAAKLMEKLRDDDKSIMWIARIIIENPQLAIHFVDLLEGAGKRHVLTLEDLDKLMRTCTVTQFPSLLSVILSMTKGMTAANKKKLKHRQKFLKLMAITMDAAKKIDALMRE